MERIKFNEDPVYIMKKQVLSKDTVNHVLYKILFLV